MVQSFCPIGEALFSFPITAKAIKYGQGILDVDNLALFAVYDPHCLTEEENRVGILVHRALPSHLAV